MTTAAEWQSMPPLTYRVLLPSMDADRLNATRNQSQTSVCLMTPEETSQQHAEEPEQDQSILAETCFVESIDRRHKPDIDRHQMDGHEPAMERQATE